jgi:hypothetical protein
MNKGMFSARQRSPSFSFFKNKREKKGVVCGIILLFIGTGFLPSTVGISEDTHWLEDNALEKDSIYFFEKHIGVQDNCHVLRSYRTNFSDIIYNRTSCKRDVFYDEITRLGSIYSQKYVYRNTLINDDLHFYGESNASIYIVKVSSPYEIIIDNISASGDINIIGEKTTSGANYHGVIITNGTEGEMWGGSLSEWFIPRKLQYVHVNLGGFNHTYDKRLLFENWSGVIASWDDTLYERIYPPGTWYFIFTSGIYDLNQEDVLTHLAVWINFSDTCQDVDISTREGGKLYLLWYGEFDANLIISKARTFEMMLNGKQEFHINNTFLYTFSFFPYTRGFWNIQWDTPDGIKKLHLINTKIGHHYTGDFECIMGTGRSGEYELRTSYLDQDLMTYAEPIYFFGVDVPLF